MTVRAQTSVSYKTLVKRTLVEAIKAAFTVHPDAEFENVSVTPEFPIKKQQFPSVFVRFNDRRITNVGVGHQERFRDDRGVLRRWGHRRFEGDIEITVLALSPLSRDMLVDALVEMVAFGRLDPILGEFYDRIYGGDDWIASVLNRLTQISMNVDEIDMGGETASLAPWGPEDVLIYQSSLSIPVQGGFYNMVSQDRIDYISGYKLYQPTEQAHFLVDDNGAWVFPISTEDEGTVTAGGFGFDVLPIDYVDTSTASGTARPIGSEQYNFKYPDEVLLDTPVAYWRGNETSGSTLADATGNGFNLTKQGGATVGNAGFVSGGHSLGFPNSGSYFNYYPASDIFPANSHNYSVECFLKTPSTLVGNTGVLVGLANTVGSFAVFFGINGGYFSLSGNNGVTPVAANTTYHLVAVVEDEAGNSRVRLYVNGVEESSALTGALVIPLPDVGETRIGLGPNGGAPFSQIGSGGLIAEVALYDYALSADRIEAHYNARTA